MWFNTVLSLALLLCALGAARAADPCPSDCSCTFGTSASCMMKGIQQIPPGYFPKIQELNLLGNNIATLGEYDLTGFKEVRKVTLSSNKLTVLNLNTFAIPIYVVELDVKANNIENVIALEEGRTFINLKLLDLRYNQIASVPEGWLDRAERLEELWLAGNSLVIPGDRPFLPNCPKLRLLSLRGTDASQATQLTFDGLALLDTLYLENTGITELGNTVANLPSVKNLYLDENPFTEIRRGAFSKQQNITRITFAKTKLEVVEAAALDGAMGGSVSISDTPLACDCGFEALYWWAQARNIILYSECRFQNICQFSRRMGHLSAPQV